TDNGKVITNVPSTFGDSDDNIIYHVEKNPTKTTISIEGSNGKAIGTPESATGEPGNKTNLKDPQIPEGYHLVNITDNGKVITKVPSTFGDSDNNIIYNIAKNPSITVKVLDSNGKEIENPEIVTGDPSSKVTVKVPSIPEGYHIVKITNEKGQTVNGVPNVFGNNNEVIEYHIAKDNENINKSPNKKAIKSIKISIENDKGEPIGIPRVISGVQGEKANVPVPTIPEGYKLNNITINGAKVNKIPNTFGNVNGNVVLHVSKSENSENPKTGDTSNIPEVAGILGSLALLLGINLKKKNPVTK
ncbi:MucBP domain-containing protein, partial [Clostridium thermobutyricum]|uniref:MucBP domain-containing protein n=1 Tax=Clostridium thermobutyricum TaxID=29372 RepID=UPI0029435DD9